MEDFNAEEYSFQIKQVYKNNVDCWYFDDIKKDESYLNLVYLEEILISSDNSNYIDKKFIFRFYKIDLNKKIVLYKDKERIELEITENNLKKLIKYFSKSIDDFFNEDNIIKNLGDFLIPVNYNFKFYITSQNGCEIENGEYVEKHILASEIILKNKNVNLRYIRKLYDIYYYYEIKQHSLIKDKYFYFESKNFYPPGIFTKIIRKIKKLYK